MGWICSSGQRRVEVGREKVGKTSGRSEGFGKSVNGMDMSVGTTWVEVGERLVKRRTDGFGKSVNVPY